MNDQSAQRAIKAALSGNWNEAIEFNLQILKDQPDNIEALNRLARAYASIGQTKNAKKTWNKVIRLDPYNPIANQQLEKLKSQAPISSSSKPLVTSGQIFLDEPGKTKTSQLVRLAPAKTLIKLVPGQRVKLLPKKRSVAVVTQEDEYLGCLPDDLSQLIIRLIKGGNKYETLVRRVEKNNIHIFIKEVKRSKRYQHQPSFAYSKTSKPLSINSGPINEAPIDITPTGEEESSN